MRYYAIARGKTTGIFDSWEECREYVSGYSGAIYKSFNTPEEAQEYLDSQQKEEAVDTGLPYAYIDGSYSKKQGYYSYGGFIAYNGNIHIVQGKGNDKRYLKHKNITGETRGAMEIMLQAKRLGIKEINIYHDYLGISKWATGGWKCDTELTKLYRQYYEARSKDVKMHFIHIKGHTGNEGNEIADLLAKEILNIKTTKKAKAQLEEFKNRAKKEGTDAEKNMLKTM